MATILEKRSKMTGEIISYKFMCCVGRDEMNKQIWRTKTIDRPDGFTPVKEQKEVQRIASEWEREQKAEYARTHSKDDKMHITLAAFIQNHWWPDHVLNGDHTPKGVEFFRYTSDKVIEYFGTKKLGQIDAEAVKRYVKWLRTEARTISGKPFSDSTVKHYYSTLCNILKYAERFGYIDHDPTDKLTVKEKPRVEHKPIDFLAPEEAKRYLACLEQEPLFWQCFDNVLITCGLRRGEAVGLQWGDLDGKKMTLTVQRNVTIDRYAENKIHVGETKTKKARTIPMSPRVYDLLQKFRAEQTELFGKVEDTDFIFCSPESAQQPIYPTVPTKWQARFVERNKLPHVSPHDLRHTAATLALESGASLKQVQMLMGHSNPATTMQYYTGVTEEAQKRTVEGIENLLA